MQNLKNKFIFGTLFVLVTANFFIYYALASEERDGILKVIFLDIGQGDAIFIEAPNGNQMLIDGGSGAQVLSALSEVMPTYDHSIDVVLATHPDKDHIGGLPLVLDRFDVEMVIVSGAHSDTATFEAFENKIEERGVQKIVARRGMRLFLDDEIYFDVLYPDADVSNLKDTNEASIVAKLIYKNESFLLTGDAPIKVEQRLVSMDSGNLDSNVLKLGHHGSRTSTSGLFLNAVTPEYAIVSAGCKNSYGHPHKEVIALLGKFNVKKFGTCESGTVLFRTDGEELSYETEK